MIVRGNRVEMSKDAYEKLLENIFGYMPFDLVITECAKNLSKDDLMSLIDEWFKVHIHDD